MVGEGEPTIHGFSRDGEFTEAPVLTLFAKGLVFYPIQLGGMAGSIRAVTGEPSIKDCTISEEQICR